MSQTTPTSDSAKSADKGITFSDLTHAMKSVCAAFFGVQSEANRQQDFEELEQPFTYVIAAVILASVFISCLFIVILWITHQY